MGCQNNIEVLNNRQGLYIAMILEALDIPNLSYEILEGSDRVGGRVYTHHFSDTKHDYYDASIKGRSRIQEELLIPYTGGSYAIS